MIPFNRLNDFIRWNAGKDIYKGYDQTIYSFDIENSNGYVIDGVARPFDYSKDPAYYADKEKVSLLYLWQFGVNDTYFYGRTLEQLKPAIEYLASRPYKSVVFVHNLSHEFVFLLNIIKWDSVFARKAHKPMKACYGSLEFRCTYMLTRQSLKNVGKTVGLEKYEDFDYDAIKTPTTPLTASETRYGSRDVEIVYKLVKRFKSEYTSLQRIPLTQTGRPRLEVKAIYKKDMGYHRKMARLLPSSVSEYAMLRAGFVGGWVHGNYYYNNIDLIDLVFGKDITSSYPYQMVSRLFPMSPWAEVPPESADFYIDNSDYLCMLKVTFYDVRTRGYNDYLSISKVIDAESEGVKAENGRIYRAKKMTLVCTSVDFQIMRECYESSHIEIRRLWYSVAGYLDIRYVNYILELYENKVKLTGDPEKAELRARSKELLNSLYGMMVSALIYDDVVFDGNEWLPSETDPEKLAEKAEKELETLRSNPYKVFLSFSHGVFVTAYARLSLWECIKEVGKDVVYHDTDSIYCVGNHAEIFERYNARVKMKLKAVCKKRGIDINKCCPKDLNGVHQWLGVYTCDNDDLNDGKPFHEFKTLGAKRYCYRMKEGDPIKITIAGVNKKTGAAALHDDIANFKDGLVFDYRECGKLLPHYNTEQPPTLWIDRDGNPYLSRDRYGITLQPARYVLDRGQTFIDVLEAMGSLSNQFSELSVDDLASLID